MNKRLLKRHKRQVARARERVKVSEPDLRTPEQVKEAREASRSLAERGNQPHALYSASPPHHPIAPPAGDAGAKADEGQ